MTARACETISWKEVEGSRSRNFRVMRSGVVASDDFVKKRRPSLEGWVRAERREEMWWRTGVEDANSDWFDCVLICLLVESSVAVCKA